MVLPQRGRATHRGTAGTRAGRRGTTNGQTTEIRSYEDRITRLETELRKVKQEKTLLNFENKQQTAIARKLQQQQRRCKSLERCRRSSHGSPCDNDENCAPCDPVPARPPSRSSAIPRPCTAAVRDHWFNTHGRSCAPASVVSHPVRPPLFDNNKGTHSRAQQYADLHEPSTSGQQTAQHSGVSGGFVGNVAVRLAEKDKEISQLNSQIAHLERRCNELDIDLRTCRATCQNDRRRHDQYAAESKETIAGRENRIEELHSQLDEVRQKVQSLNRENSRLQTELLSRSNTVKKSDEVVGSLQAQNRWMKIELERLQARERDLQAEFALLRDGLPQQRTDSVAGGRGVGRSHSDADVARGSSVGGLGGARLNRYCGVCNALRSMGCEHQENDCGQLGKASKSTFRSSPGKDATQSELADLRKKVEKLRLECTKLREDKQVAVLSLQSKDRLLQQTQEDLRRLKSGTPGKSPGFSASHGHGGQADLRVDGRAVYTADVKMLQSQIKELENTIEFERARNANRVSELEKKNRFLANEKDQARLHVAEKPHEKPNTLSVNSQCNYRLREYQALVFDLQNKLAEVEAAKKTSDKHLSECKHALTRCEGKGRDERADVLGLKSRCRQLEDEVAGKARGVVNLENKLANKERELEKLRVVVADLEKDYNRFRSSLGSQEATASALEREVTASHEKQAELQDQRVKLSEDNQRLRSELTTVQKEHGDLQRELDQTLLEQSQLRDELRLVSEKNREYEAVLKAKEEELQTLMVEYERSTEHIARLESRQQRVESDTTGLMDTLQQRDSELVALRRQVETMRRSKEEALADGVELRSELARTTGQLDARKQTTAETEAHVASLRKEIDQWREKVQKAETAKTDLTREIQLRDDKIMKLEMIREDQFTALTVAKSKAQLSENAYHKLEDTMAATRKQELDHLGAARLNHIEMLELKEEITKRDVQLQLQGQDLSSLRNRYDFLKEENQRLTRELRERKISES